MAKETAPLRPINVIAGEIRKDWQKVNFAAVPYLNAMFQLNGIRDKFYEDDAKSIIAYFLGNATSWRGETAKAIKKELNAMLKVK
jgi:hypothetical protein